MNNELRAGIKIKEPKKQTCRSLSFLTLNLKIQIPIIHHDKQKKKNAYIEEL